MAALFPPQNRDWALPSEANLTPRAAERICREAAKGAFDEAAQSLNIDWKMQWDGKQIERWSEACGRSMVASRDRQTQAQREGRYVEGPANAPQLLVIGMDGGRWQSREKDEETGSRWKEDKVLSVSSYIPGDGLEGEDARKPRSGERFQGVLPPLAERPVFAIRKRATVVFTLDDYVSRGILSAEGAATLRAAVVDRKNILVAGGTGSGKTTLVNAILAEPAFTHDRVVIIEDTKELQCSAEDKVELLTKNSEPRVTMTDLLRMTLRLRPDRIIIGEVRGGEALAMLKAWNTGHPGGVATVHANSAADALQRIEDLVGEASAVIPRRSIASAINLVAFIERVGEAPGRRVSSILAVNGLLGDSYTMVEQPGARK